MNRLSAFASVLCLVMFVSLAAAQATQPAARGRGRGATPALARIDPTPEQLDQIKSKLNELNAAVAALKAGGSDDALIAEAEVSAHVVGLTLRFPEEFFDQQVVNRCISALDAGLVRAKQIKEGNPSWATATGRVSRALRSRVDGTPQPYRVIIPASYDKAKPIGLYVYLHGRGDTDLGLGWLGTQGRANGEAAGADRGPSYMQLQVFGRANNSFRYPGETDVFEAIAAVQKLYNIDPNRILLAGFSMGGAGSWQIGLRCPDMFCGLEIDAGVIGNRRSMDGLTPSQKANAATYGITIDHAANLFNIPLVAYAGENDAQLAASTSIREQLVKEGYTVEHPSEFVWKLNGINVLNLANPKQGHSHATGETAQMINAFNAANFERGRIVPDHIKFVTYTTRYNRSFWVTVDGMQQHFDRALVDAVRDPSKASYTISTTNVSRLLLTETSAAAKISIDGDTLNVKAAPSLLLARVNGHWQAANATADTGLRKQHNLQGPINDAFFDSFICVTPSGQPYSALANSQAMQELARFERTMAKEYRGAARTKADSAVTDADITGSNLILFGDPGSNAMIAKIADKLPIKWTRDGITVGAKKYSAAEHVPVLIYPNPLNPKRYVVINTGLVAGGGGGAGAGYGDWAVLKISTQEAGALAAETADGGVFDESWKLATSP